MSYTYYYPPVIDSYLPAVIKGEDLVIPYSVSPYQGTKTDLKGIHWIMQEQNTNITVLEKEEQGLDSPKIPTSSINIHSGSFYKIQLRFIIGNNIYSEWSKVCVIKVIAPPQLIIEDNWEANNTEANVKQYGDYHFRGYLSFADMQDKEYLKSYRVKLYDIEGSSKTLLEDSGVVLADLFNPNQIDFQYNVDLSTNIDKTYELWVTYTTNNLYSPNGYYVYPFIIKTLNGGNSPLSINITSLSESGGIRIDCYPSLDDSGMALASKNKIGNYIISRSSVVDDFTHWEDVHLFTIKTDTIKKYENGSGPLISWTDYTVEPGHIYHYGIQTVVINDNIETRGIRTISDESALVNSEHIYLYDGKKNLQIKYNPSISSFKKVILEAKTETLGSTYPFIRRNGDVGYRQFSISGLISYNMDDTNHYVDTSVVNLPFLDENLNSLKAEIDKLKDLSEFSEEIYLERRFREAVMNFLYADDVKLFKSETEGIMLVRLMDISLTPEQVLGRRIYSFSATVYEVAEATAENLKKYGIISIDNYVDPRNMKDYGIKISQCYIQQTPLYIIQNGKKIEQTVMQRLKNDCYLQNINIISQLKKLLFLRITFLSQQQVFEENGIKIKGHCFTLNGAKTYVLNNIFQINDNDINLENLSLDFNKGESVLIDYIYQEESFPNLEEIKNITQHQNVVGQIFGTYNESWNKHKNILNDAKAKYTSLTISETERKKYFTQVSAIKALNIEAPVGAILIIGDAEEVLRNEQTDVYKTHIMNTTGQMFYISENESSIISSIQCNGIRLYKSPFTTIVDTPKSHLCQEITTKYNTVEEIRRPKPNTIYTINNIRKIYYKGEWYLFNDIKQTNDNKVITLDYIDIDIPVTLLIDYYFDIAFGWSHLNQINKSIDNANKEV